MNKLIHFFKHLHFKYIFMRKATMKPRYYFRRLFENLRQIFDIKYADELFWEKKREMEGLKDRVTHLQNIVNNITNHKY